MSQIFLIQKSFQKDLSINIFGVRFQCDGVGITRCVYVYIGVEHFLS